MVANTANKPRKIKTPSVVPDEDPRVQKVVWLKVSLIVTVRQIF